MVICRTSAPRTDVKKRISLDSLIDSPNSRNEKRSQPVFWLVSIYFKSDLWTGEKRVQLMLDNDEKLKKGNIPTIRSNLSHSYTHRGVLVKRSTGLVSPGKTSSKKCFNFTRKKRERDFSSINPIKNPKNAIKKKNKS